MIFHYHLLWIKLYVPLILKPCLYLVLLEEDKCVQRILLHSIILISVPNMLNCMLRFNFDLMASHSYPFLMMNFSEAACLAFLFDCFRDIRILKKEDSISGVFLFATNE